MTTGAILFLFSSGMTGSASDGKGLPVDEGISDFFAGRLKDVAESLPGDAQFHGGFLLIQTQ